MTVTPRYQAYADAWDTGLKVPLKLPVTDLHDDAAAQFRHQLSDDQLCQQPMHSPKPPLQPWAALYHCRQKGVDRVFVDHPLFLETYGKDNANTYLQGGSHFPDLDLQYSILCQAALAAPILLWHQPQDHLHRLQLQALVRKLPQTLSGGIAQYIGLDAASASLVSQDSWLAETEPAPLPSCADVRSAAPAVDSVLRKGQEVTDLDSAGIIWPASVGNIAFVGNDWPCFPLSQHLHGLQSLAYEGDRAQHALIGAPQASTPLACSAANNFEAHMARLLKSARVAFCIHNLAYQGIFAQVRFLLHCLLCSTTHSEYCLILTSCKCNQLSIRMQYHAPSTLCSTVHLATFHRF